MAARDATTGSTGARSRAGQTARRLSTETKQFFKTSEFAAFVLMVIAILIAGNAIEGEEGGADFFAADKVWLYITILTVGYMISRASPSPGCATPTGTSGATATPTTNQSLGVPPTATVATAPHGESRPSPRLCLPGVVPSLGWLPDVWALSGHPLKGLPGDLWGTRQIRPEPTWQLMHSAFLSPVSQPVGAPSW